MLKEVADCGNLKYEGVHNDWKLLDPPKATTTTFVNHGTYSKMSSGTPIRSSNERSRDLT